MARFVELVFRANNTQAMRSLDELSAASKRTAAETERAFRRSQRGIQAWGTGLQSAGRSMTMIGGGMAIVGGAAIKQSMNFQTAMTRLTTQAQVGPKLLGQMSQAVLKLGSSGQVPYGPTELANALYHIESVAVGNTVPGLRKVSTATNVLKIASQGAAIGGSDLEQTTTALMGAMAAMHAPASQAAKVMGLINATVGAGNMRMQDLVYALGRGVIPAFKQVGMTANDAFAAIALVADQGTKAGSAAAQLATALHYLVGPSDKATKVLNLLSLSKDKLAQDVAGPGGLLRGLTDIKTAISSLPKYQQAQVLFDIMPAGRGRVLMQILNNLGQYGDKLKAVMHPQVSFNQAVGVWSKTLSARLHISWAQIQTDLVKMGNALSPIVSRYLPMFTKDIREVVQWFTQLPGWVQKSLVKLTAVFLVGGPILYGVGRAITLFRQLRDMLFAVRGAGYAAAGGEAAAAEAGAAGGAGAFGKLGRYAPAAAVAAALAYTQLSKHHQQQVQHDAGKALHFLNPALKEAVKLFGFKQLGQAPNSLLSGHIFRGISQIANFGPYAAVSHGLQAGVGALGHLLGFGHSGGLVTTDGIRGYASGGYVDNVPAMLQVGEGVLNRTAMSGIGIGGLNALNSGGGFSGMKIESAPVYVMLDGRVLARAVLQQTLRKAARGPSSLAGGALTTGVSAPVSR